MVLAGHLKLSVVGLPVSGRPTTLSHNGIGWSFEMAHRHATQTSRQIQTANSRAIWVFQIAILLWLAFSRQMGFQLITLNQTIVNRCPGTRMVLFRMVGNMTIIGEPMESASRM